MALLPLLTSTSSWIITQPSFEGVAWTVQQGVAPGPETPQPATGAWSSSTQAPLGGLAFSNIAYSGPASRSFTLSLVNDEPRHLGLYARFLKSRAAVVPTNWKSRLPSGVPTGFESDTVKYLGVLSPNSAVAGIPVDGSPQTITIALPDNADAAQLLFGGLGNTAFSAIPDAAGVLLTFVLDIFVPWVVQASGRNKSDLAKWYGALLADPEAHRRCPIQRRVPHDCERLGRNVLSAFGQPYGRHPKQAAPQAAGCDSEGAVAAAARELHLCRSIRSRCPAGPRSWCNRSSSRLNDEYSAASTPATFRARSVGIHHGGAGFDLTSRSHQRHLALFGESLCGRDLLCARSLADADGRDGATTEQRTAEDRLRQRA